MNDQNNPLDVMYSATFGNNSFTINPPKTNNMEDGFPSIPYIPIEAIFYEQAASNPMAAPYTVLGGGGAGQQVIASNQIANDSTTTPRYIIGTQYAA